MDDKTIMKLNRILKLTLLIGFALIIFLSFRYGFTNCSKCPNWEYEGENITLKQIWRTYMDKCLKEFTTQEGMYDLNIFNNTIPK